MLRLERGDRSLSIIGRFHPEAPTCKVTSQDIPHDRVVVDDQDQTLAHAFILHANPFEEVARTRRKALVSVARLALKRPQAKEIRCPSQPRLCVATVGSSGAEWR